MIRHKDEVKELAMSYAFTNRVCGDYLEFGVYYGEGMIVAHHAKNNVVRWGTLTGGVWVERAAEFNKMRFIGFDSFEGLSEPREKESHIFSKGDLSLGGVLPEVPGVQNLTLVKGWFSQTLNDDTKRRHLLTSAAIINIDCDLFDPSLAALRFCTSLVQDGTVLILDDWFLFKGDPAHGQQKALEYWKNETGFFLTPFYLAGVAAFLVHK